MICVHESHCYCSPGCQTRTYATADNYCVSLSLAERAALIRQTSRQKMANSNIMTLHFACRTSPSTISPPSLHKPSFIHLGLILPWRRKQCTPPKHWLVPIYPAARCPALWVTILGISGPHRHFPDIRTSHIMHIAHDTNLMDRPRHLICHSISCPVFQFACWQHLLSSHPLCRKHIQIPWTLQYSLL